MNGIYSIPRMPHKNIWIFQFLPLSNSEVVGKIKCTALKPRKTGKYLQWEK
jgi:hypothetical protein